MEHFLEGKTCTCECRRSGWGELQESALQVSLAVQGFILGKKYRPPQPPLPDDDTPNFLDNWEKMLLFELLQTFWESVHSCPACRTPDQPHSEHILEHHRQPLLLIPAFVFVAEIHS